MLCGLSEPQSLEWMDSSTILDGGGMAFMVGCFVYFYCVFIFCLYTLDRYKVREMDKVYWKEMFY